MPPKSQGPALAPAARLPKLRAAPRGDRVREAILDCAEQLFAERGFYGASIRDITERAELRLAAVNYHFGTKEGLFRDVLLRRANPLNARRLELLEAVASGGPAGSRLRAVTEAFVLPVVELARGSAGFRRYLALVAQVASSRLPVLALVAAHFNHVAERFMAALGRIYPAADEAQRLEAYQLLLGATLYAFSGNQRLESLGKEARRSQEIDALAASVVRFAAAGIEAVLTTARPRSGSSGRRASSSPRRRYPARSRAARSRG
jgi:AcrR family transcriptional regulator